MSFLLFDDRKYFQISLYINQKNKTCMLRLETWCSLPQQSSPMQKVGHGWR
jgi:hypothetical protein